jgi:exodeoxyribonuclease VII large subunit
MLERRWQRGSIARSASCTGGSAAQQSDEREYRLRERPAPSSSPASGRRTLSSPAPVRRASPPGPAAAAWRQPQRGLATDARVWQWSAAVDQLAAKLSQLSPLRVLERGYAIVSNQAGIVTDAAAAPPDSRVHVRLHRGALDAVVEISRRDS